ncbi:unnamed protein product [Bursaphelenchus okinawaensis]|uniref:Serpentine receptor class gamma n=1 Tax=Bursaphelenchus okinawaensis TaxID=465554 RepID=A0A811KN34_9BILA|nr:unnamed protein product [Bursaphelenchus okinawaensis]CAG9107011.1 unnamed protein product [Bursaphelenchus okinawaensis]
MHNFTQTVPINPLIDYYCKLILDICMYLSIFIVPLLFYLVFTQSKCIKRYKYFLMNNIFWCVLLTITFWYCKIHLHFPAACVHFEPFFPSLPFSSSFAMYLFTIGIVNVLASMACTILYRLAHAQMGSLQYHLDNSKRFYIGFAMFQVIASISFMGSLRAIQITDPAEADAELALRVPHLQNSTVPFICVASGFPAIFISFGASMLLILFAIVGGVMLIMLHKKLMSNKVRLSERTAKLQFMLFYALSVQIVSYYVFELFPLIFDCLGFTVGFVHGEAVTLIMEALTSVHSIVDYICIIYFIVPYRRAVVKMARRLTRQKIGPRRQSTFSSGVSDAKSNFDLHRRMSKFTRF